MNIARRSVEFVVFIMGAFSGVLNSIAPPDETKAAMMIGIASFAALIILLIISAIADRRIESGKRIVWIVVAFVLGAVFVVSALRYNNDRSRLTMLWPPDNPSQTLYVTGGDKFTPSAQEIKRQHPEYTPERLVSGFGGIDKRTSVWSAEAIREASRTLNIDYLVVVLSVATAIFSIAEGVFGKRTDR